jgi:hypothetical protein
MQIVHSSVKMLFTLRGEGGGEGCERVWACCSYICTFVSIRIFEEVLSYFLLSPRSGYDRRYSCEYESCAHSHAFVHTHTRAHTHTLTHTLTVTCTRAHTHTPAITHTCHQTRAHTQSRAPAHMHTHLLSCPECRRMHAHILYANHVLIIVHSRMITYVHTHTHTHTHTARSPYTSPSTRHTHTYIHTHVHTHTYTYIHRARTFCTSPSTCPNSRMGCAWRWSFSGVQMPSMTPLWALPTAFAPSMGARTWTA